jgi:hypothetical protein
LSGCEGGAGLRSLLKAWSLGEGRTLRVLLLGNNDLKDEGAAELAGEERGPFCAVPSDPEPGAVRC